MRNGSDGQKSMFGSFCKKDALARLVEGLKVEEGLSATNHQFQQYGGVQDCSCGWKAAEEQRKTRFDAKQAWREHVGAALHLKREQEPAVRRWANTGPNGEMCPEPQGEFVLWRDVKRQVEPSSPFDMLRAAQPPQELVSLREACIQSLAEHEAIYEVMLLEPRNKGMLPPAIIAKLRAALTRGAVRK